mmetsp:Transcript_13624/g.26000  ORF Transcript_13624/g.26000 Transcript_13624/m.26000 type:complete len:373 (-) Transcript_13624:198-1316(-)
MAASATATGRTLLRRAGRMARAWAPFPGRPSAGNRSVYFSAWKARFSTAAAPAEPAKERKEEEEKKDNDENKGIPWFTVFVNILVPSLIYWQLKRRAKAPRIQEVQDAISIQRNEMGYLLRNTKFKTAELYWIQDYAHKYFKNTVGPDQWGKFFAYMVSELEMHRKDGNAASVPAPEDEDEAKKKKIEDFDVLVLYRCSPTIPGTRGQMALDEALSGLSILSYEEVLANPEKPKRGWKPHPFAKFDLAWSVVDKDGDNALSREEFGVFCSRLLRFGFISAESALTQTRSLPSFPPEFKAMTGDDIADLYYNLLGISEEENITRAAFEETSLAIQTADRLHYWHLDDPEVGFFGGIYRKYKERFRWWQAGIGR